MNNNIYPPDHLLRKWESLIIDEEQNVDVVLYEAFQAGADQELEACCEYLTRCAAWEPEDIQEMRDLLHLKPPSLKEQALKELRQLPIDPELGVCASVLDTIRRALESLPD